MRTMKHSPRSGIPGAGPSEAPDGRIPGHNDTTAYDPRVSTTQVRENCQVRARDPGTLGRSIFLSFPKEKRISLQLNV